MKYLNLQVLFFVIFSNLLFGQNETTITVNVPKNTEEVYIVGNQESLGNWNPKRVKMTKKSDSEYSLTLDIDFPAEFKFTRGSWESQGIIKNLGDNPNLIISGPNDIVTYQIKNWADKITSEAISTTYLVERIRSNILGEERMLKIYVPENTNPQDKFPIIYLTDADVGSHFELALQLIKQLEKFNIIPKSILVGITQKNRGNELDVFYTENGKKFKNYIFKEVIPFINNKFSTSGFNSIIGHSDGATFNHILMAQEDTPFRGYINISENLFNNQYKELETEIGKTQDKPHYVYIASGEYDSEDRINSGKKLDSLFNQISSQKIKHEHKIYKAEHNDIFAKSLLDGIQFIFSDYNHLIYDENKLKSLALSKINAIDFWKKHIKSINDSYGIDLEMNRYDFEFVKNIAIFAKDMKMYEDVLTNFSKFNDKYDLNYYAIKAQEYERMGLNEKALELWFKNIEEKRAINHIFYYRRPYELLLNGFDKPKEAIQFLESSKNIFPDGTFYFNYYIAKAAIENSTQKKKAKSSLEYCLSNFENNPYFSLEDVQNLAKKLK